MVRETCWGSELNGATFSKHVSKDGTLVPVLRVSVDERYSLVVSALSCYVLRKLGWLLRFSKLSGMLRNT